MIRKSVAAIAAVALMATPAVAAPFAADMPASTGEVAPASERVDGLQALGGDNMIIVVAAIVAVGLGIWALLGGDDKDAPASP